MILICKKKKKSHIDLTVSYNLIKVLRAMTLIQAVCVCVCVCSVNLIQAVCVCVCVCVCARAQSCPIL